MFPILWYPFQGWWRQHFFIDRDFLGAIIYILDCDISARDVGNGMGSDSVFEFRRLENCVANNVEVSFHLLGTSNYMGVRDVQHGLTWKKQINSNYSKVVLTAAPPVPLSTSRPLKVPFWRSIEIQAILELTLLRERYIRERLSKSHVYVMQLTQTPKSLLGIIAFYVS